MSGRNRVLLVNFGILPMLILASFRIPLYTNSARQMEYLSLLPKGNWGYISAAITICGYIIYISQMFPDFGKSPVKPHPLSWFLFGAFTLSGWIIQNAQGGREGSWCLGISAGFCFLISLISYRQFSDTWKENWKKKGNLAFDIFVTGFSSVLFVGSILTRNNGGLATITAFCATGADFVSYLPTFKKGWLRPNEDSATNYFYNSVKCLPALLAIDSYSFATTAYLWMLLVVNGLFWLFLLGRRVALAS